MYLLKARLVQNSRTVGYLVLADNGHMRDLSVEEVYSLADQGLIHGVTLRRDKANRRHLVGIDMHSLEQLDASSSGGFTSAYKVRTRKSEVDRDKFYVGTVYTGTELIDMLNDYPALKQFKRRDVFKQITEYLMLSPVPMRAQCLAIMGISCTGKTVLLMQAVQFLLNNGVSASDILYIWCDKSVSGDDLRQYLSNLDKKYKYLFIDEVTNVLGCTDYVLSLLADGHVKAIRGGHTVIAGTESLTLVAGSRTALKGRNVWVNTVLTSYNEFCRLYGLNVYDTKSLVEYATKSGVFISDTLGGKGKLSFILSSGVMENLLYSIKSNLRDINRSYEGLDCGTDKLAGALCELCLLGTLFNSGKSLKLKGISRPVNAVTLVKNVKDRKEILDKVSMEFITSLGDLLSTTTLSVSTPPCKATVLAAVLMALKDISVIVEVQNGADLSQSKLLFTLPMLNNELRRLYEGILNKYAQVIGVGVISDEASYEGHAIEDALLLELYRHFGNQHVFYYRQEYERDGKVYTPEVDIVVLLDRTTYMIEVKRSNKVESKQAKNFFDSEVKSFIDRQISGGREVKCIVAYTGDNKTMKVHDLELSWINICKILSNIDEYIN